LRLLLEIPAAQQAHLRPGAPVTITIPDRPDVKHLGTVRTINSAVRPETGTVTAEVWFANRDHQLRAGTVATGEVRLERGGVYPVIPAQAVFALAGEQHVYRLEDDGKIHDTKVTLGAEKN